jgi:uncharacterized protein (DUF433 family)
MKRFLAAAPSCVGSRAYLWVDESRIMAVVMLILESKQEVPLEQREDSTIYIKGSRVTLDLIIHHFKLGATPEQIQDSFPSLALKDICGAIYYYLDHTAAVEEYLREQTRESEQTRQFVEERVDSSSLRQRIRDHRANLVKDPG